LRFEPGQLVSLRPWCTEVVPLYRRHSDDGPSTGELRPDDVAVVLGLGRSDGSAVYVMAGAGMGWTFGALLRYA